MAADTPKTKKVHVRNTARGIRGLHLADGLRNLEPGELLKDAEITEAELASAESTGHFAFGKAALATDAEGDEPQSVDLDALDDDTLRTTIAAITGKPAPADADRAALLALARGEG